MKFTEKLYCNDACQKTFDARLIGVCTEKGWIEVGLSAVLFSPGGVGRPEDGGPLARPPVRVVRGWGVRLNGRDVLKEAPALIEGKGGGNDFFRVPERPPLRSMSS